ncbi:LysR family transcriptional regulator [Gracilibacillus oryzae]|uniref:LysR family transcriptional regulator n=1 Tax=Gracilibacillus oryzae TaxID=1672701 RepID=A0A7C8L568_9BACI|nr:LysR family transcriptional regulator [Gracilibacillus oryzae]KAB8127470.1 LysR family transcriptional regulator [Gracilibacillus oryzae]
MNIHWLRTFVTAAKNENFRQTAEELFLAQPTVTTHIKQLEKNFHTKFFRRSGRNIVLTEAGHRFLPHANLILSAYEEGAHDLTSWHQGYKKTLTLAVSPILAASVLPYIIRQFMERYQEIEVIVQVCESSDIGEMIEKGEADIGLSRMHPIQTTLTNQKIMEEDVVCVCPHDGGDMESSPPIDLDFLIETQTLFTFNHPEYWDSLLAAIRGKHQRIRTMIVSQVHITKRFIEEGLGFSFLPKSAVRRELMEGRMLEADTPGIRLPRASTYIITRGESKETSMFQTFLREYFSY